MFLTVAGLCEILGDLEELAAHVNIDLLSEALIRASKTNTLLAVQPQPRLWLLAHLIRINRIRHGTNQEPIYMRALSVLISSSASEIVGRIDADELESLHHSTDDEDDTHINTQPLPRFVKEELVTLVNKQSITGLLEKFNTYVAPAVLVCAESMQLLTMNLVIIFRLPQLKWKMQACWPVTP